MGSSLETTDYSVHYHSHTTVKMAWHKGTWWPLYVKEWYGPRCSQHMFDPYSFCLLVLGMFLHLLWGTDNIGNWVFGFVSRHAYGRWRAWALPASAIYCSFSFVSSS